MSRQPVGQLVLWSVMSKLTTSLQPPSPPRVYSGSGTGSGTGYSRFSTGCGVDLDTMVYHLILNICTALSQ